MFLKPIVLKWNSGCNETVAKFFYTTALYYVNLDIYPIIYIEISQLAIHIL